MTSVVSVLLLAVALTNVSFHAPACQIDVKHLDLYVAVLTQRLRPRSVAQRPAYARFS